MIHYDLLGRPAPGASVTPEFHKYQVVRYLMYTEEGGDFVRQWPGDTPLEHIAADLDADGYDATIDRLRESVVATHRATAAEILRRQAAADIQYADSVDGFVRYGGLPPGGRSGNHRDQVREAGVSVFRARFASAGGWQVQLQSDAEHATWLNVRDRPAYRVYGDVVGFGSDGEPVLRVTRTEQL